MLYGLERSPVKEMIELSGDYPALIAEKLAKGEIDVGLIPVAALKALPTGMIVGNHCIATQGEAASVCLFSQLPISQIEHVLLDYQSKTSVALLSVLMRRYWKKEVKLEPATDESFIKNIQGTTAGVIIGDRALKARAQFPYIYDLGKAWKELTGLPFVFAVWASVKPIPDHFIEAFDKALVLGLEKIREVVDGLSNNTGYDMLHYYTVNLDYTLDDEKRKAIALFWKELDLPA